MDRYPVQVGFGEQEGNPAVAVQERMYPHQPVMGRCRRHQLCSTVVFFGGVGFAEPCHECGQAVMARRLMLSDPDWLRAQLSRHHPALPAGIRICHDLKLLRQQLEKLPMQRTEKRLPGDVGRRFSLKPTFHLPLYRDMGDAFHLQVALGRFGVVLLLHGSDDIVGVGVMPLDQVGIVAIC